MRRIPLLAVLAFILAPTSSNAQATIRGVVRNTTGQPVAGAQVRLLGRTGALADSNGNYILNNLPAGRVRIEVTMLGYVDVAADVDVARNQEATRDFVLPSVEANTVWLGCRGFSVPHWSCAEPIRPQIRGTVLVLGSGKGLLRDKRELELFWARQVTSFRKDQNTPAPSVDFKKYFVAVVSHDAPTSIMSTKPYINRIEYGPRETVIVLGEDTVGLDRGIVLPGVRDNRSHFDFVLLPRTRTPIRFRAATSNALIPPSRDWTKTLVTAP